MDYLAAGAAMEVFHPMAAAHQKSKMEKNLRISHQYFLLGLGLISLIAYTLLLCALSLIRGYPVSFWQFPLAILLMGVTQFFAAEYLMEHKARVIFLKTTGILLLISVLSVIAANAVYDVSFDGQWYHQEMINHIKTGFNPYLKTLPAPDDQAVPVLKDVWCSGPVRTGRDSVASVIPAVNLIYLDINHFAKGIEIVEASIYRLTGRVETGKAVNAIILLGSFFLCLSLLYKLNRFSTVKKWLIAILASFNPITISQLCTFCVDGVMVSVFLSLFVLFCLLLPEKNKYYLFLLGLLIMISVNIKFTSLVYTAIFCTGFLLLLIIRKQWVLCKKVFYASLISALLGVFFIGFHPYMTNLISTNQVFYGLKETRNEIYDITPSLFRDKNRFEKLFISLGTYSDDQAVEKSSVKDVFKIPFTINKQELLNANAPELKLAGFGPFFSGALLISLVLIFLAALSFSKQAVFRNTLAALGILFISILIIPDSWWARFVPQLWFFPVFVLFMAELLPMRRGRHLRPVLYLAIGANVVWTLLGIFYNLIISSHIQYQLTQLKTISQPISVEYCAYRPFRSNEFRFNEHGIRFIEKKVEGKYIYNVIHSNTKFGTEEELPDLPKPFLMKLNEKLKGGDAD
jgi:hypothetical protein